MNDINNIPMLSDGIKSAIDEAHLNNIIKTKKDYLVSVPSFIMKEVKENKYSSYYTYSTGMPIEESLEKNWGTEWHEVYVEEIDTYFYLA